MKNCHEHDVPSKERRKKLNFKMKFCFLLTILVLSQLSANSVMSQTKMDLNYVNAPLKLILKEISSQTGYRFFYNVQEIDDNQRISLRVQGETTLQVLANLSFKAGFDYKINKSQIVLIKKVTQTRTIYQQLEIKGSVKDKEGMPLPGASIIIKGTTSGVTTDFDGNFVLGVADENVILLVSYIGFATKEVELNGQSTINIILEESVGGLDEVVVVGYGTQKKVNLTGSVSKIIGDEFAGEPSTSVASLIQGRMPGVYVTQQTGLPGGEESRIVIRGIGTMNNTNPMVLVDGIEASMDNISPDDIESISVLKDAASAAIYGTRAANGVILVTTKRGSSKAAKIDYNYYVGYQTATNLPNHLSSAQYASLLNEGMVNEGLEPQYTQENIATFASGSDPFNYPNTDWLDLILKGSGFTMNHNLSIAGGGESTRYRASLEYYEQQGLMKRTSNQRYNFRLNLDHTISEHFSVGYNIGLTRTNVSQPKGPYGGGDLGQFFRQANIMAPSIPNKLKDGSWGRGTDGNPVAWIEADEPGETSLIGSELLSSMFGEVKIIEGLTFKGIAGINYLINDNKYHVTSIEYGNGSMQGPNDVQDEVIRFENLNLQGLLTYDRTFGSHGVKVLLGAQRQNENRKYNSAYRRDFPSNRLDQLDAGSTDGWRNTGSLTESNLGSYFGRLNYDYKGKYLLESTVRRDASSKFAKADRVGWFPSVSGGWRISEEKFLKEVDAINNIKIRASWGQLGNHRIDDYLYIQNIALGQNYNFGGAVANGAAAIVASNPNLTWETTTEANFGLDVSLFKKNVFSFSLDYYNRLTDDILINIPVSQTFGLPAPIVNAGSMRNKGIEVGLNYMGEIGKFQYDFSGNFSINDNNVEKFPNPSRGRTIRAEGVAWDSFYGYEVSGIFQSDDEIATAAIPIGSPVEAGDLRFKDQNNDGKIDGDDRVVLGNTIPKVTYGLNVNFKYGNFDFTAFFQGAENVYRTLGTEAMWAFGPNFGNPTTLHLDRTIVENGVVVQQGNYPRILINETQNHVMSSFLVLNSSYLRLRNIQFGYNLPKNFLETVKISRAKIYLNGQNLLTFTKFPSGYDPEIEEGRANFYPLVKFVTFGLNISF